MLGRSFSASLSRLAAAAAGVALLTCLGCGGASKGSGGTGTAGGADGATGTEGPPAPNLSRKLSQFVYVEEGRDLTFMVGVFAAGMRDKEGFFPLEVSLINKEKATWNVTRESFTLVDEDGTIYEPPTYRELSEKYFKRSADTRLFQSRAVTAEKQEGFFQLESNFFPDPMQGVVRNPETTPGLEGVARTSQSLVPLETLEIPSMFFIQDVLYFPRPEGAFIGRKFRLEFRAQGLEEPALISIEIPRLKKNS